MTSKAKSLWHELTGESDGPGNRAGIFCMALLLAEPRTREVVQELSCLDAGTVSLLWARAEKVGLIQDGTLHCNWLDETDGPMSIVMDSLVLQGLVDRV